jgi:hypothetical protein
LHHRPLIFSSGRCDMLYVSPEEATVLATADGVLLLEDGWQGLDWVWVVQGVWHQVRHRGNLTLSSIRDFECMVAPDCYLCVSLSCSMRGIAESIKEFGCVLRSCHDLCAMDVCACYASHTMVAWYGCCRWWTCFTSSAT